MEYIIHIVIFIIIYAILAQSIDLLIGHSGIFAVCVAGLFGVGAYASSLLSLNFGISFILSMLFGLTVGGILGAVLAIPSFKVKGDYMIIASFGFQILLYIVFLNWESLTHGPIGLAGIPKPSIFWINFSSIYSILLLYFCIFMLCSSAVFLCIKSPFGRLLKAIKEDEDAVLSLGKNVSTAKVKIFAFSAALAGLAGSLYAHYISFIDPSSFVLEESIFILTLALVGGSGTFSGPIVGAIILVSVPEALRFIELPSTVIGNLRQIIYGSVLVAFVVFWPEGIMGRRKQFKKKEKRVDNMRSFRSVGKSMTNLSKPLLEVRNLFKSFGGIKALDDLSLNLDEAKITALVGPNGAGKTTLFDIVTGFLKEDKGTIFYKGKNITKMKAYRIPREGLARTFQGLRVFQKLTVLDNILLAKSGRNEERILNALFRPFKIRKNEKVAVRESLELLNFVGLYEKRHELAENISYGQQKMLALSRILSLDPKVLLLDEPTSGLDYIAIDKMIDVIKNLKNGGKTICLVEHNLDVVRKLAEWIIFLDQGKLVADNKAQIVLNDEKLAEIYFGT